MARSAKFWVFYKRAGQRVLINDRGDMLVRPTFTELSIQQSPMGSSVFHVSLHRTVCVQCCTAAVLSASSCCKLLNVVMQECFLAGHIAALSLLRIASDTNELLECACA